MYRSPTCCNLVRGSNSLKPVMAKVVAGQIKRIGDRRLHVVDHPLATAPDNPWAMSRSSAGVISAAANVIAESNMPGNALFRQAPSRYFWRSSQLGYTRGTAQLSGRGLGLSPVVILER